MGFYVCAKCEMDGMFEAVAKVFSDKWRHGVSAKCWNALTEKNDFGMQNS